MQLLGVGVKAAPQSKKFSLKVWTYCTGFLLLKEIARRSLHTYPTREDGSLDGQQTHRRFK